jgi:hypothetical protein
VSRFRITVCRGIAVVAACHIAVSKAMAACSRSAFERRVRFGGEGII